MARLSFSSAPSMLCSSLSTAATSSMKWASSSPASSSAETQTCGQQVVTRSVPRTSSARKSNHRIPACGNLREKSGQPPDVNQSQARRARQPLYQHAAGLTKARRPARQASVWGERKSGPGGAAGWIVHRSRRTARPRESAALPRSFVLPAHSVLVRRIPCTAAAAGRTRPLTTGRRQHYRVCPLDEAAAAVAGGVLAGAAWVHELQSHLDKLGSKVDAQVLQRRRATAAAGSMAREEDAQPEGGRNRAKVWHPWCGGLAGEACHRCVGRGQPA